MKKVLISIFLILICYLGYGQSNPYPLTQNIGSAVTKVQVPANGALYGGLIPLSFTDTTSASAALTYGKTYNGFLIYTTGDSSLWFRCCGANKWSPLLQSGGTAGVNAWLVNGNTAFSSSIPPTIGTIGLSSIGTKTNNTLRYTVPAAGIVNNNGAGVKILGVDTSDATLPLVYTEGGGAGWELTGNAGTNDAVNFIGTTDGEDLVFKRNNVVAGKLQTSTTSFGVNSLFNGGTNDGNSAFGAGALYDNLTGDHNTAIGENSLSQITGDNNIGLGAYSGFYPGSYSNRLFINSLDRSNVEGDTTQSIIYGYQDANPANQRLSLNSQIFANYIKIGSTPSDEIVGRVSADGRITPVIVGSGLTLANDTLTATSSGPSGSGTTNYLPKWSSSTALGNSAIKDSAGFVSTTTADPAGTFTVDNTGHDARVGINLASPSSALDVLGNAQILDGTDRLSIQGTKWTLGDEFDDAFSFVTGDISTKEVQISASGTSVYANGTSEILQLNAANGTTITGGAVTINDLSGTGTRLVTADATGVLSTGLVTDNGTTIGIISPATTTTGLDLSSSTLTSGSLATFTMTGTAAASNTKRGLVINSTGTNATASQTVTGMTINVGNLGTTNTNVGLDITASGATTNNALRLTGHVIFPTDATYDIGASGATRPRTGYFGSDLIVGRDVYCGNNRYIGYGSGTAFQFGATSTSLLNTNYFAIPTGVTTGTSTTSGLSVTANSLTTGNGVDFRSSSLTTGNLASIISTSTVHNNSSMLNIQSTGVNSTASKTTNGLTINIANTGTTPTNMAINITAGLVKLASYTVATLPTGVTGAMCYVTDATAPTYGATLVGGGAVVTIAFYDGTNWTAH